MKKKHAINPKLLNSELQHFLLTGEDIRKGILAPKGNTSSETTYDAIDGDIPPKVREQLIKSKLNMFFDKRRCFTTPSELTESEQTEPERNKSSTQKK